MKILSTLFGERIVSHDLWPTCSLEITLCDLFLSGYLKDEVHKTEDELERKHSLKCPIHLEKNYTV